MSLNVLRRSLRQQVLNRTRPVHRRLDGQRRSGGGGIDMPTPRSMKAELWQGHPKHEEGWEKDLYITYGIGAVMIIVANAFKPDTDAETWAAEEAQARLDLKAQGFDKFEFGKHYKGMSLEAAQAGAPADVAPVSIPHAENEEAWEDFNKKATKTEDDDEDDEEGEEDED